MSSRRAAGMIAAVVVSQGTLARELVAATERIVGPTRRIRAVSLEWDESVEAARAQIAAAIREVDCGGGVLLFTDMFGGTPTNVSLSFLDRGNVEILTGVNLPMLVKFASLQQGADDLLSVAHQVQERGQKSVYVASEILTSR